MGSAVTGDAITYDARGYGFTMLAAFSGTVVPTSVAGFTIAEGQTISVPAWRRSGQYMLCTIRKRPAIDAW